MLAEVNMTVEYFDKIKIKKGVNRLENYLNVKLGNLINLTLISIYHQEIKGEKGVIKPMRLQTLLKILKSKLTIVRLYSYVKYYLMYS